MNHSPASRPTVLLIGDLDQPEIQQAVEPLRAAMTTIAVADVDEALAWLAAAAVGAEDWSDSAPPELIVVAQSWPEQFSADDVHRLRCVAPLVRVLSLAGTWCDGESRTGDPWPADFRASWHQWPVRLPHELARRARGECPIWGLPITAADDERLLWNGDSEAPTRHGLVAIQTRDRDMAHWLAESCLAAGFASVWLEPGRKERVTGIVAGIWDGTYCDEREAAELQGLVVALVDVPVVTLLDFPRVEDCQRARSAGAAVVLSKPLLLDDFTRALLCATACNQAVFLATSKSTA